MRTLVKISLFLVFHNVCQANEIEKAINQYPQTLLSSGAKADDLLVGRLSIQGLPKEFFNLPKQAQLREAILIDMLAFYYLGYRVTSLFVKTDDGFFTRSFSEKGRSVSEWQSVPQTTFENAAKTLKEMKALPLSSLAVSGKPSGAAINGYLGDRTYNSVEPQAPNFASYIGIVSVLGNAANRALEIRNQFPMAIQDYWDVSVTPGNREPRLGRVLLAIQGKTTSEVIESKQAQSLEAAIIAGDSEVLNKTIKSASEANAKFQDQWSPLMLAISAKQLVIANMLIARGANVNAQDKDGTSALALAISSRWRPGIELLLSKKANPNTISTFKGETPLSMLIWQKDLSLIELLLRNGANPNFIGAYGADALHTAIQSGRNDDQAAINTTASIVKLLLKYGANTKYVADTSCTTALSELRQKSPQLIEALGPLLSASETPRLACQKKRDDLAKQTSANQPTIDRKAEEDRSKQYSLEVKDSAIMAAMRLNKSTIAVEAQLRSAKAVDLAANIRGQSALHLAVDKQDLYKSLFADLLKAGVPYDTKNQYGVTPLMLVAGEGWDAEIKSLLKAGASLETTDKDGATPLIFAVLAGKESSVALLLSSGAKSKIKQLDGSTPLSLAKQQGFANIAKILEQSEK
jgi:uncharacterized protein